MKTANRITEVWTVAVLAMAACLFISPPSLAATKYSSGAKTWDTTTANWGTSPGGPYDVATFNSGDSVVFEGTGGAVTLGGAISVSNMTINVQSYTFSGGSLNFVPGGVISNADNRYWITISSPITGSPAVDLANYGVGNQYKGIIFSPSSGTMALGTILNPAAVPGGNTDKAGVDLSGSTTGNTVASIGRTGGVYADTVVSGTGEWTVGDLSTGTLKCNGGSLIVNGTLNATYGGIHPIASGAKLGGDLTIGGTLIGSSMSVSGGGILSPGDDGVGTISAVWGGSGAARKWTFNDNSIYEWDVGAVSNDTIELVGASGAAITLGLSNFVLKVQNAGGSPGFTDQLPVFTYNSHITVDTNGFGNTAANFDVSEVPQWGEADSLSLVDNGTGMIYLTGLNAPAVGMVLIIK